MSYSIQLMGRTGLWSEDTVLNAQEEAIRLATFWARFNPNAAWGVRVVNVDTTAVVYEA